jgi:hypothetical protein
LGSERQKKIMKEWHTQKKITRKEWEGKRIKNRIKTHIMNKKYKKKQSHIAYKQCKMRPKKKKKKNQITRMVA